MSAVAHQPHPARAPAPAPDLRIVSPARRRGRYLCAYLLLIAIGVFGVVSLNALAAESAFAARELEREVTELSLRYEELTASVAALESPQRVRDVALSELGMTVAADAEFLVLDTEIVPVGQSSAPAITAPVLTEDAVADPVKQTLSMRP